jgi:hypothetical protein
VRLAVRRACELHRLPADSALLLIRRERFVGQLSGAVRVRGRAAVYVSHGHLRPLIAVGHERACRAQHSARGP